jgi:hypothetical protein
MKNLLININNIIFMLFYFLVFLISLVLHYFKTIQLFCNYYHIKPDNKRYDNYAEKSFNLNTRMFFSIKNVFGNYINKKEELTEIMYVNRTKLFNINNEKILNQFLEFKLDNNLDKFNINFFTNNYLNNNKYLLYYFHTFVDLFSEIFKTFKNLLMS